MKKNPAEGNGQGRTAAAADAIQASCGARLYLSNGLLPLACWRGDEKGEMPSVCNFFLWSRSSYSGKLVLKGVVANKGAKAIADIRARGVPGIFKVRHDLTVERD